MLETYRCCTDRIRLMSRKPSKLASIILVVDDLLDSVRTETTFFELFGSKVEPGSYKPCYPNLRPLEYIIHISGTNEDSP